jgi:acyl-CoA reductase-like NAD-dependent aldehyde dehydrogenase
VDAVTSAGTGQVCLALKRLYVPRSRYDEVIDGLKATLAGQKIGPGLDPNVTMSPLNTAAQRDYVARLLEEARASGAEVQSYGEYTGDWTSGNYMLPSLVLNPAPELGIVAEEQFGPALPVMPDDDEEQAIPSGPRSPVTAQASRLITKDLGTAKDCGRQSA